jgi:hypothetical protein
MLERLSRGPHVWRRMTALKSASSALHVVQLNIVHAAVLQSAQKVSLFVMPAKAGTHDKVVTF